MVLQLPNRVEAERARHARLWRKRLFLASTLPLVLPKTPPYNFSSEVSIGQGQEVHVQLDDNMKQLLRELGHAINDTVSDSERIAEAIAAVRAAGFDIVLRLDATIGLARRNSEPQRITVQDRRFLESLHIRVDEEILDEDGNTQRLDMTAQDIKFLKSLKISLDESI